MYYACKYHEECSNINDTHFTPNDSRLRKIKTPDRRYGVASTLPIKKRNERVLIEFVGTNYNE